MFWVQYQVCNGVIQHARDLFDIGTKIPIYVYYRPFDETAQAFAHYSSKARSIYVGDLKAYDHWVRRCEAEADYDTFCEDSPLTELAKAYSLRAPLIHPWGINFRKTGDGRLSGEVPTNMFGGIDNVSDHINALLIAGLPLPIAVFVNGDDIILIFGETISEKDLAKLASLSYHVMEPDKSSIRTDGGAFYGKRAWWVESGKGRQARPIALGINSLAFTERDSSIVSAGKEYTYVATGNIVADVGKDHPYFDEFAKRVASLQKYHIGDMDKGRLIEAAKHYAANKWNNENESKDDAAEKFVQQAAELLG